jgi:Zn-dependent peptidase ImmA (M78 family)/DNA-binding XRE family transcriptional regulator
MISDRLRQLRLAKGITLEELSLRIGGLVTRAALSKYELGESIPSITVVNSLAHALGVKSVHLWTTPEVEIKVTEYRRRQRMPAREQARIESVISVALEERVRLQRLIDGGGEFDVPVSSYQATSFYNCEAAAVDLRDKWNLGDDPIPNMVRTLEDHRVHVLEVRASEHFDAIAAVATDREDGSPMAAAVIIQEMLPGDRQRFDLGHELGHLVLNSPSNDPKFSEKAAHRFSGAFLAPARTLLRQVGTKRREIPPRELLLLKQRFGMSLQALLHRLRDLDVISEAYYKNWCVYVNVHGWKRQEPAPVSSERPEWLRSAVLRAYAEQLISRDEAERLSGSSVEGVDSPGLIRRREFLNLQADERGRILQDQAAELKTYFEEDDFLRNLGGGEFMDHD